MSTLSSPDFLALQQALAGRYSLTRELGRGGMGIVYLAQEVRLDRPVALKVLPPERTARDERERFLREARTAARLSHPHIVPIHAVHDIGDFVLYAMSYIQGETLGERIRTRGPLPARDAARILREVGWALAYAHAQGVVHRDVKPDNILLETGSGRAIVTDFGIAHVRTADESARPGDVVGTPEFMSPEQARGGHADERSDLYALGVVGYYMLSGRLPYHGATSAATIAMHLTMSAPPLATVAPGLPAPLASAVDRCLARDPEQRFASGEELAAALAQALEERRDLPVAIRHFMKQNHDSSTAIVVTEVFSVGSVGVWGTIFATGLMEFELAPLLAPLAVWVALGATPVVMLIQMARRLLRAGYDQPDLVRAMQEDLQDRRAELADASERSRRLDDWLKRLTFGGLGVHAAGLAWLAFGPWIPGIGEALGILLGTSGTTWVMAGSASAARHHLRGKTPGRGWLRFWEGAPGRTLFRAARVHLEQLPSGAPYGPTELAIGMAADRLYDSLPTGQRRAFPELPEVVRRLEADAERLRTHMKELDVLIGEAEAAAARAMQPSVQTACADEVHAALVAELKNTRGRAEDRLRDVVAALETIRVELLRLHAGAASTASVTMDLSAAIDISSDVARMVEATREVQRILGRRAASQLAATPTPA